MEIEYKTVRQLATCGQFPFSMGQLRTFLLNREKNGLNRAVRKIGRRLYIRKDYFEEWIESMGETNVFET